MADGNNFSLTPEYSNVPKEYTKPMDDPYNKAIGYLEKHNILQIFQNLTTEVIYNRPPDPLDYLIKEVQKLKQENENQKK